MHADELRGVLELHFHGLGVGVDRGDLQRRGVADLEVARRRQGILAAANPRGQPDANPLAGGLDQQVVVAGRQVVDGDKPVANRQRLEPVGLERPAAKFQKGQFAAFGLLARAHVRQRNRLADASVNGRGVAVTVLHQVPRVPRAFGPRGHDGVDVLQRAQRDPPGCIGL